MEIANALNQIMNAKRSGKKELRLRSSKLLVEIMKIMEKQGYVNYKIEKDKFEYIIVTITDLNECKAITPRFYVKIRESEKYVRRFLPARNFGFVIVSTNKGLMKHDEAEVQNLGGCLVAYVF